MGEGESATESSLGNWLDGVSFAETGNAEGEQVSGEGLLLWSPEKECSGRT